MRTFLDENRIYGSTFLLYGNINDDFYCPDASIRKLDQYLVALLKSRGYDYIIFFGTGGTRGAYCLDAVSARFFFGANEGLPLPEALGESGNAASTGDARPRSGSVEDAFRGRRRRRGYNSGDLSAQQEAPGNTPAQSAPQSDAAPRRIQYSLRRMDVAEFYPQFREKILNPQSRSAIVFYDVLTDASSPGGGIFLPSLKDDILTNFSQTGTNGLCLIVAPETMQNTRDLQSLLLHNGLGSKFLRPAGQNEYVFNCDCCFQVAFPGTDEIKNMLHRFAVVGTSRHRHIRFAYDRIDDIAERILADSSVAAQRNNNPLLRKMRSIAYTLEEYINSQPRTGRRIEITPELIDSIWDIHTDPQEAMKKLERRGWENACRAVQRAIRSSKNAVRNLEPEAGTQTHIPDIGLERCAQKAAVKGGPRMPIPNFILLGHPGTGKTEIARLIGQILYSEGILKVGHTTEVTREQLTSSYRAGVPKATMNQVDKAEEGVLFIDEAHSLGFRDGGAEDDGTGREVISTLNAAITDPNRHFCTILAGYPEKMQSVFDLDSGFRGRFSVEIRLDDYDPDLLYEILLGKIRDANYQPDPELIREQETEDGQSYIPLKAMVERIYAERDRKNFRNADAMKKQVDHAAGAAEQDNILRQEYFYGGPNNVNETFFTPIDMGMTKEKVFAAMDEEFVGMAEAKAHIRKIARRIQRKLDTGGSPEDIRLKPIVLVGNPGTGKTSIARLLPKLLYHFHVLGSSTPVIHSASELASIYSGGVQEKVLAMIQEAQDRNAFLFIDEAHELTNPHFDGAGALKAFMAPTTDPSKPFVACFGVYPTQLDAFLQIDPGSRSRFDIIRIEDYKPDELHEIFTRALAKQNYTISDEADAIVKKIMTREYLNRTVDTGNARNALDILKRIQDGLDQRCEEEGIPYTVPRATHITAADIPADCTYGLDATALTDALKADASNLAEAKDQLLRSMEEQFVGMSGVKDMIYELTFSIERQLADGKRPADISLDPIVLVGNPGTGKTSVANLLPKLYYHYGILGTPTPVLCTASSFASRYYGGAQEAAQKYISEAQNSRAFLFVDEAHELCSKSFDGAGALKSFMAPLTDHSRPFQVCFAVYPDRLEEFLAIDPGSRSRFENNIIRIDDYTPEELYEIFVRALAQQGYTAREDTLAIVRQVLEREYQIRTNQTGNARRVHNLLKEMTKKLNRRCSQSGIPFTSPESRCFLIEDIPENYRKGLSLNDNTSRIAQLEEMLAEIANSRVGNVELKKVLTELVKKYLFRLRFPDHATDIVEPGHYFFKGNAGTGKTTSLDFMADVLFRLGLVKDPKPIRLSASHLVGQYLGETAVQTRQLLEQSLGRVIMIDEAYALTDKNDRAGSYKQDAVNEIVAKLDDETFRRTTCVVFAGYDGDMDQLYLTNQGLQSRVTEISFPDFTHAECVQILLSMLAERKAPIQEEALELCSQQITVLRSRSGFSNGRTIRNYANVLISCREQRMLSATDQEATEESFPMIQPRDTPENNTLLRQLNL